MIRLAPPACCAALLVVLLGCEALLPSSSALRFSCERPSDCVGRASCVAGVCVRSFDEDGGPSEDAGAPVPDAGDREDAGAPGDAGPEPDGGEAGDLDAGDPDAGDPDAGDLDGGPGGDAGGADAGGEDAGADAGQPAVCGDGIVAAGEACDDGDGESGDGCDACAEEVGYTCLSSPSLCVLTSTIVRVPSQAASVGAAIAAAPDHATIVVAAGEYVDEQLRVSGKSLTIVGDGAVRLERTLQGPGLAVSSGGAVRLVDVQITTSGAADGAILVDGASLVVESSTIGPSRGVGIEAANGADVEVRRSRVRGNRLGGLLIDVADYVVESNFVFGNGVADANGSTFGGAAILTSPAAGARFAFNTVAFNDAAPDRVAGVLCDAQGTPLSASILWGNGGAGQATTDCAITGSIVQGSNSGSGVSDEDPRFVDEAARDLHLQAGSPCEDALSGPGPRDVDGQPRDDGAPDCGADERR